MLETAPTGIIPIKTHSEILEMESTCTSVVLAALCNVFEDCSSSTGSREASDALEAAKLLKGWCETDSNGPALTVFCDNLVSNLQGTVSVTSGRLSLNREKMWKAVFYLCTSTAFVSRWVRLLQSAGAAPTPILYQHLTDLVLRFLIREHYPITDELSATPSASAMSTNEANALRYAAGYVVRSVSKKITKTSNTASFKEDLTSCCQTLVKQSHNYDEPGTAEDWTDLVDRGGLWHIKETTFQLICAFEEEIRKHLHTLTSTSSTSGLRAHFLSTLINSDDVQFYWCIASADFDVDDSEVHSCLLNMIVELFITVLGFAYASAWIEHYKQSMKKSTQCSKSLRKELYTDRNM